MLRYFIRELWKVYVGGKTAYSTWDPHICVVHYLWHMLQYHQVMGDFKYALFHKLPYIYLIIVNILFVPRETRV